MNLGQFKDPLWYLCLIKLYGNTLVLVTQEVAGWNNLFNNKKILSQNSVSLLETLRENST